MLLEKLVFIINTDKNSIRQFLYTIFLLSSENEGILPCLWDISEKVEGDMKYYYNKETNEWADKMIGENLFKISKGDSIKAANYYNKNNIERDDSCVFGYIHIDIGSKKVKTIILNVEIVDNFTFNYDEISVSILIFDKNENCYEIECTKGGKRQYDGSITYTIDVTNIECYNYVEAVSWIGTKFVALNYLTLIYQENYNFFDYKSYKSAVLKEISEYL